MVLYNDEKYLDETFNSLLAQTYIDFKIVICDDCSSDRSGKIAQRKTIQDDRLSYYKNETRVGLAANSRLALDRSGESDYFAWASGHDVYQKEWLEKMINALESNPDAVMAYPLSERISATGDNMNIESPIFDTTGMNTKERIRSVCNEARGFGNMIYGLFRTGALKKAGVFPDHLAPDALLITMLSLQGSIIQVKEKLWQRRFGPKSEVNIDYLARQKNTVFAKAPFYTAMPWAITHLFAIAWNCVLKLGAGTFKERYHGLYLTYAFTRKRWRWMIPQVQHRLSNIEWLRKSYRYIFPRKSNNN